MASMLCATAAVHGWVSLLRMVLPAMQLACVEQTEMADSMEATSTVHCGSEVLGGMPALEEISSVRAKHAGVEDRPPDLWQPAVSGPVVGVGVSAMVLACLAALATTHPAAV